MTNANRLTFSRKTQHILKQPKGEKPNLSIVVIALNEEKRIVECLNSLRNQQVKGKIEIILADGCSTDKTVELALPLVDGLIQEQHRNCSFERNAGSLLARADIIAFCDSDSLIPPNWAQTILDSFAGKTRHDLVGVYGVSGFYDTGKIEKFLSLTGMNVYARFQSFRKEFAPANSNYAFWKSAWDELDGMDVKLTTCEDHDFFARASKLGKIVLNPKLIVYTSARRVRKMGYLKFLQFQLNNAKQYYQTGKSSETYENVR